MVSNQSILIHKIEYYNEHPDDEDTLGIIFSSEERAVLYSMSKFEKLRLDSPQKVGKDINEKIELSWEKVDREREISFDLKNKVMRQLDILLGKGSVEAWMEIITWYHVLKHKRLIIDFYWEFPVLEEMIEVFKEEVNDTRNKAIAILEIRNMKELTEVYFRMIFLLRRMAYGAEVTDELVSYRSGKKLFPIFVKVLGKKKGIEISDWENIMINLSEGK